MGQRAGGSAVAEPRSLVLPAALWFLALLVLPIGIIVAYAFATREGFSTYLFGFNLSNFGQVFDPLYRKVFRTTVGLALAGTIGCALIAYPFAYWLATRVRRHRAIILLLVIVPFWTSLLVRTYAWVLILSGDGPLSALLERAGLIGEPLDILYSSRAVWVGLVYDYLPLMIFPIYVSLERLDPRLLEASRDLGAGAFSTFRRVTLPLTKAGIVTGSLLVFIPMTGEYVVPAILGGARTFTLGSLVAFQFLTAANWPFGAALSVSIIVVMLLVVALYLRSVGREAGRSLESVL